jgi:Tfp pilus assembly protein PilE
MNKRNTILVALVIILAVLAYGWYQFSRGHADLASVKPDIEVNASKLHEAFAQDEQQASQQYVSKIVAVTGEVKAVKTSDKGTVVTIAGGEMGDILCSLSDDNAAAPTEGNAITLIGECTGALGDADLGLLDVNLVRCVVK